MDLKEFLQLSAGKWFAQRTTYHLVEEQPDNSKSELTIDTLGFDHPEVIKVCQQHNFQPTLTTSATKVSWDNSVDWGKAKDIGSSLLIFVPDADNPQVGQILKSTTQGLLTGRYVIGNDESLTLTIENGEAFTQERQWFVSPNLRIRSSFLKSAGNISSTVFYSEIRKIPPKTEESLPSTATSV